jgi:hypothetical protein
MKFVSEVTRSGHGCLKDIYLTKAFKLKVFEAWKIVTKNDTIKLKEKL